jgi:sigma-E factor negative regulatory protein RseB
MMLRQLFSCLAACLAGAAAAAWAQAAPSDAAVLLQRIGAAAREMSYSGVFVHSSRDSTTTSRIVHISDRGGEWEKTEFLDGPAHEIIRRNEELYCYHPESKTIRIDRRISGKFFPSLLNGAPQSVAENYSIRIGPMERIGGHDCQWLVLEPKDSMRFLQELCAEKGSGLLLRARMFNDRNQLLEQFTFTELKLGKEALRDFSRGHIKSRLQVKQEGWQTDDSAQRDMKNTETGWVVANPPAGFRKVVEMQRTMTGKIQPVSHLVFSDGMASVSVFVEPLPIGTKGHTEAAEDGMGSYALRTVADHQVTVLGDVPLGAAQLLANGVGPKAR